MISVGLLLTDFDPADAQPSPLILPTAQLTKDLAFAFAAAMPSVVPDSGLLSFSSFATAVVRVSSLPEMLMIPSAISTSTLSIPASSPIILGTAVGRVGVCGFWGAGQGISTRNGYSIPRSYNAAMRPKNRAIQPVADSPNG